MDDLPSNIKIEVIKIFSATGSLPQLALKLTVESTDSGDPDIYVFDLKKLLEGENRLSKDGSIINPQSKYQELYYSLTKREQQVLIMVANGKTSPEIAEKLFIAVNTVKNHRRNIKKKLGLPTSILYSKFLRWIQHYIKSI